MPRAKKPTDPNAAPKATRSRKPVATAGGAAAAPAETKAATTKAAIEIRVAPINIEEQIRYRAYELYVERGGTHGMDQEDWFRAETELRKRSA